MAYFHLWDLAEFEGDAASAERNRQKALEHIDRLPERQRLFVEASLEEETNLSSAAELLESLLARHPDDGDAWSRLAWIYYPQLGDTGRAVETLGRGVKAIPDDPQLRIHYGYNLLWAGRYPEAISQFQTYAQLSPREPNPYDSLAEAYLYSGEPELKMWFNLYFSGPSVFANNPPSRDGLARVKKAQGDLRGAIKIYRELNTPGMSAKWTAWFEPRYVLETARLLDQAGDKDSARTEYERFLEYWKDADPELPELQEAKKYLGR